MLRTIDGDDQTECWKAATSINWALSRGSRDWLGLNYVFTSQHNRLVQLGWAWEDCDRNVDANNTFCYENTQIGHRLSMSLNKSFGKMALSGEAGWEKVTVRRDEVTPIDNYAKGFQYPTANVSLSGYVNKHHYRLTYALFSLLPTATELRRRVDDSNPYFLVAGNPLLRPVTNHQLQLNFNTNLTKRGHWLSSNIQLKWKLNSIVGSTEYFPTSTILPNLNNYEVLAGSSLRSYENMNGAYEAMWYTMVSCPVSSIKSTFSGTVGLNHAQEPFYYGGVWDKTKTNRGTSQFSFMFNGISGVRADLSASTGYVVSSNESSSHTNKVFDQSAGIALQCTPVLKYFFANASYTFRFQQNFSASDPIARMHILNMYVGCKLFKRNAEWSFTAYDLLNSCNTFRISTLRNYVIMQNQENFGRYFTINFSWTFRKIKSNRIDLSRGVMVW